ncbi:hypothetical protein PHMEG_00021546 [Phytophthora megakarya]|uniref:Uncharacterized protein n=1 Tax=Phytophthora megakarya TaxID=4795 RepID=A0A225VN90_9STRA|nr:hypothetical protein PHMEG_00021546 [Phytophthora megakarya]
MPRTLGICFLSRSLTLMHCRPADLWDQVHAQDTNVSFTEFSECNILRPAQAATCQTYVRSSLRRMKIFAQAFYADEVSALIDSAIVFFGAFRGFVVARDLVSAQGVQYEFSRVDEEIMELMDLRRSHRGSGSNLYRGQNNDTPQRGDHQRR